MTPSLTFRISTAAASAAGEMAASYERAIGCRPAAHFHAAYLDVHSHLAALHLALAGRRPAAGAPLIEIGSGVGTRCILARALLGCRVIGVEPACTTYAPLSRAIPAFAEANPDHPYEALARSGAATGLPSGCTDLLLSHEVLEHVDDPAAVLVEMRRLLRPGGRAMVSTCNYASFYEGHYRIPWRPWLGPATAPAWVRRHGGNPAFLAELNLLTWRQLCRQAVQAGFTVQRGWRRPTGPPPPLELRLDPGIEAPLPSRPTRLQDWIQRPWPHRLLAVCGMHYKIAVELVAR